MTMKLMAKAQGVSSLKKKRKAAMIQAQVSAVEATMRTGLGVESTLSLVGFKAGRGTLGVRREAGDLVCSAMVCSDSRESGFMAVIVCTQNAERVPRSDDSRQGRTRHEVWMLEEFGGRRVTSASALSVLNGRLSGSRRPCRPATGGAWEHDVGSLGVWSVRRYWIPA